MRSRIVNAIVAAVAAAMLLASAAWAHDHRPPPAPVMRIADQRQVGAFAGVQWTTRDGRYCVQQYGDGVFQFPRAITYGSGQAPSITIRRDAPPVSVELHAWRSVNRYGYPKGRAEDIPAVTTPVVAAPGTPPKAWKIEFVPPPGANHLYLILDVKWVDQERCASVDDAGDSQWATWIFHVRRTS